MIKRQFYKVERADRNEASDSFSSSSDSESEAEPLRDETEEEEVEVEAVGEAKEEEQPCASSSGSGYKSEDSSGNEVDVDSSGLLINDDEEISGNGRQNDAQLISKRTETEERESNSVPKKDSVPSELSDCILKCKSVFKCRLCPRIVCLTEETLRAHLNSKRHSRSEKLLREGRLKLMLNSDGEIEEEQETHAERHARTVALAQDSTNPKKKNRGRQRQRLRRKQKMDNHSNEGKTRQSMNPAKKRRRNED